MDRRRFLGLGTLVLASACSRRAASAPRDALTPTPHLDDEDDLPPVPVAACTAAATATNIEGPFYRRGAPHRSVLVAPGDEGVRLHLTGAVRTTACEPLANASVDVWQANSRGDYDLDGFRFRGVMTTDARGRYDLQTIVPGRYLNGDRYRPAHLHIKVRAAGQRVLTTQLYFEGDPYNDGDPFIDASLIMPLRVERALTRASFDFVLSPA